MQTTRVVRSNSDSYAKPSRQEVTSLSVRLVQEGLQLLEGCSLQDLDASDIGLVHGNLRTKGFASALRVQLTPSGGLIADPSVDLKFSLVLALSFVRELAKRKKFAAAPLWLNDQFRLKIAIRGHGGSGGDELLPNLPVKNLEELQAYWALLDLAAQKKTSLAPADLALYVLSRFPGERWKVQRAAMEAILERLSSVKKESLKPAKGSAPNHYRVFRAKARNILPYEITIYGGNLQGSCTCKDFQKNLLGLCKHTAAVLMSLPNKRSGRPRVSWRPPTEFGAVRDLKHEIFLETEQKLNGPIAALFDQRQSPARLRLPNGEMSPTQALKLLIDLEKAIAHSKISADSALFAQLSEEKPRLEWQVECEHRWKKLQSVPNELHVKLFPYQKEGVRRALRAGRFLLADEMGLGKTVQGIAWAESLLQSGATAKIIVVCPNALKFQWQREWLKTSGRSIQVVEGSRESRQQIYESAWQVLVLNYELLLRDLPQIQKLSPNTMILDEAQRIKNYMTKTSQYIKTLNPKFRLILTGTPMENRIQELSSLVEWIDSRAMPPIWSLDARMSIEGDGEGHGPKGITGFDKLRQGLSNHLLRRRRSEVLTQLPKRTDSPLYLPVTEEQKEIHDEVAKKVARLAAMAQARPLLQSEHLQLMRFLNMMRIISNGLAQFDYESIWPSLQNEKHPEKRLPTLFSPKLVELRNLIDGFLGQNVKVVIFSQWQRMLRLAHWSVGDLLLQAGVESVFFTGQETARRRTENLVRFHDDPKVRLFFATDAGGVGLNLQHAASVCINLELPWNPAVLEQRNSRIYRLGQKEPVQIFNLITRETIEERIQNLVAKKLAVFSTLFDGTSDEVRFDNDSGFYKQIQNVVGEFNEGASGEDEDLEGEVDVDAPVDTFDGEEAGAGAGAGPGRGAESDDLPQPIEMVSLPEVHATNPRASAALSPAAGVTENGIAPQAPLISAAQLTQAFAGLKFERSASGGLKIEAEGESAAILANVFKGMADLFGSLAQ